MPELEDQEEVAPPELKLHVEKLMKEGLSLRNLNTETIISIDRVFRPSKEEVAGMIQAICVKKNCTRGYLAALLTLQEHELRALEMCKKRATGHLAKLIWIMHALEFAPATAGSVLHIATWGRITPFAPHRRRMKFTREQKAAVVSGLRELNKIKCRPDKRLSLDEIALQNGVTRIMAAHYCKEAGYRPKNMQKKSYRKKERVPSYLNAQSIYMNIDWRKHTDQLVSQTGVNARSIEKVFTALKKMHRPKFLAHLIAIGKDRKLFTPIIWKKKALKGYRTYWRRRAELKKQNNTCTEIIPSATVARNDEEISATTKENLGPQTQREGVEGSNEVQLQRDHGECPAPRLQEEEGRENRGDGQ